MHTGSKFSSVLLFTHFIEINGRLTLQPLAIQIQSTALFIYLFLSFFTASWSMNLHTIILSCENSPMSMKVVLRIHLNCQVMDVLHASSSTKGCYIHSIWTQILSKKKPKISELCSEENRDVNLSARINDSTKYNNTHRTHQTSCTPMLLWFLVIVLSSHNSIWYVEKK